MSVGPFYFVYLRPRWKLYAKPTDSEAETLGHPEFWRQLCTDQFAPHYSIRDERVIIRLRELCYAMPRGRCSQDLRRRKASPALWTIYHGGDFPDGHSNEHWAAAILAAFNMKKCQAQFTFDEHETMQADDQERLQQIVGRIPYAKRNTL